MQEELAFAFEYPSLVSSFAIHQFLRCYPFYQGHERSDHVAIRHRISFDLQHDRHPLGSICHESDSIITQCNDASHGEMGGIQGLHRGKFLCTHRDHRSLYRSLGRQSQTSRDPCACESSLSHVSHL